MWKCKKVTYSLGLRYQVRCSETSTNCTVHERSTNRLHTVEKKSALHSLDRQTFEKPFFLSWSFTKELLVTLKAFRDVRTSTSFSCTEISLVPEIFVSVSEWKMETLDQTFLSSGPDLLICGLTNCLLSWPAPSIFVAWKRSIILLL